MNKSTFLANIATLMQLQWEILKSTKIHSMKISTSHVHIEATTKGSFAKDHVGVIYPCKLCSYKVTQKGELKEHQKLIHEGVKYIFKHCSYEATIIRNKCMKESNFLVHIAHMKQSKMDHLQNTRRKLMKV